MMAQLREQSPSKREVVGSSWFVIFVEIGKYIGLFPLITIQGGGRTFSSLIFWFKKCSYPLEKSKKNSNSPWKFRLF